MRALLLMILMMMPSVGFSVKGLFGFGENKDLLNQLCRDLSCSKEEILNKVSKLRCAQEQIEADRESLKEKQKIFLIEQKHERENFLIEQKHERENFLEEQTIVLESYKTCCEEEKVRFVAAASERCENLLAETKKKCAELEEESKSRCEELKKEEKKSEARVLQFHNMESKLKELCKISNDKAYAVACTLDHTYAQFYRSDFERDARFLSCGLYLFLFSENFQGIERKDGSRELQNLDGDDLKLIAQGMKHPGYKISDFKSLDKKMQSVFNSRLDFYCLTCKHGRLDVLGVERDRSFGWSDVRDEDIDGKTFTYYRITLNGVDFEFVGVPVSGDEDAVDFMMSHWVTQKQWLAVTGRNPAYFTRVCHYALFPEFFPMESVSCDDITNNFIPRLNRLLETAGFEGSFQLPSETQWQNMAAKNVALDFDSNKKKYSDFGKLDRRECLLPVKFKSPGLLGAWMFGSVWDVVGKSIDSGGFVMRGGSGWHGQVGPSGYCVIKDRKKCNYDQGFRLVRTFS